MSQMEQLIQALNAEQGPKKPRPQHEAQIDELRRAFSDYEVGAERFKPGDLVQAKKNSQYHNPGEPVVVAETRPDAEPFFGMIATEAGSNSFGGRQDMRVLLINDFGDIVAHWVESFQFEPYDGTGLIGDTDASPDAPAN